MTTFKSNALARQICKEHNPRQLARLLNENKVARVGVHPFFGYLSEKNTVYEDSIVSLFRAPSDYERAVFLFENAQWPLRDAKVAFKMRGMHFAPVHPHTFSPKGRILNAKNLPSYPDLAQANRESGSVEYLQSLIAQSRGVLVFGAFLEKSLCIPRTVRDLVAIVSSLQKEDFFIAINRNFVRRAKDSD